MEKRYDCLVVGAGLAGSVAARELAERGGMRVLLLERRDHVGGNAYDCLDEAGVLVHRYGPHIFHTNNGRVFEYLSRFTAWNGYQHKVEANIPCGDDRMLMPVPFNFVSMEKAFGKEKAAALEKKLIAAYGEGEKVGILKLRQAEDPDLVALADYFYEHVFVHYTMKQWGQKPEEIDPATTARVPVLLSRDCRYFQDTYQGLPAGGYTPMFERMLDHPNITVELGRDAADRLRLEGETVLLDGEPFAGHVIYSGALDELFDCRFGRLPYRTLEFRSRTLACDLAQSCGTVNYTVDRDYTRITEFKHMTLQQLPGVTTVMEEYPRAYTGAPGETPYYPVINGESKALYARYRAEAERCPNFHLLGRLAEYQYYNMDAIADRALTLCDGLLK